jgi:hypothetical protein
MRQKSKLWPGERLLGVEGSFRGRALFGKYGPAWGFSLATKAYELTVNNMRQSIIAFRQPRRLEPRKPRRYFRRRSFHPGFHAQSPPTGCSHQKASPDSIGSIPPTISGWLRPREAVNAGGSPRFRGIVGFGGISARRRRVERGAALGRRSG